MPVTMAERSKASIVFGRSNIGIAISNPARGMYVCLLLSVLYWPVQVEALRWTDSPAKDSYQILMDPRN